MTHTPVVIFLKVIASAALPPRVIHILSNSCMGGGGGGVIEREEGERG